MFCLEPVKTNELAFNPIGCQCQFKSHGTCLQAWFHEKQNYECPICHTVAVPVNPLPVVQYVYVRETEEYQQESRITERQKKFVLCCCFVWLFWSLFLSLFELYWRP